MSIENLKKHSGQLANTGVRVAVVFRRLPNDENNCLIVETERLPDSYHDYVMQCLNSREATETNDFYEILNRRTFPDGLNCLTALHTRGFLRKEPVSNIVMMPLPGKAVPLALINATIDKKLDEYMAKQNEAQDKDIQKTAKATTIMPEAVQSGDPVAIAKGLLLQADLLEKEAKAKKEEAYSLAPELKPGRGRPTLTDDERIEAEKVRKEKRRERDRAKAKAMKETTEVSTIDKKVQAKLQRDALRAEQ